MAKKLRYDFVTNMYFCERLGICYRTYQKYLKLHDNIPEGYKVGTYTIWERKVLDKYLKKIGK